MVAYNYKVIGCFVCLLCLLGIILVVTGCSDVTQASHGTAATSAGVGTGTVQRPNTGSGGQATVVVSQSTVVGSKPGTGPIVISTPTITTEGGDHRQLVALGDRSLLFGSPVWNAGAAGTLRLNLSVVVENTGATPINNAATYYQIVSPEGDTFGLAAGPSPSFFGLIGGHSKRSSTLTFVVPAAAKNLRLLYRPEVAAETVLFPLGSLG